MSGLRTTEASTTQGGIENRAGSSWRGKRIRRKSHNQVSGSTAAEGLRQGIEINPGNSHQGPEVSESFSSMNRAHTQMATDARLHMYL